MLFDHLFGYVIDRGLLVSTSLILHSIVYRSGAEEADKILYELGLDQPDRILVGALQKQRLFL